MLATASLQHANSGVMEFWARGAGWVQWSRCLLKLFPASQDAVIRLRQKLNSDQAEKQWVEQHLAGDGHLAKEKTQELREQLIQAQTSARKQLTDLTVRSDGTAKKLQNVITKVRPLTPVVPLVPHL